MSAAEAAASDGAAWSEPRLTPEQETMLEEFETFLHWNAKGCGVDAIDCYSGSGSSSGSSEEDEEDDNAAAAPEADDDKLDALGVDSSKKKSKSKKKSRKAEKKAAKKAAKLEKKKAADTSTEPIAHPLLPCSKATALKFMRSTKWRPEKAQKKYRDLCALLRDHLSKVEWEDVDTYIRSGAVAVPPGARDKGGRQMVIIRAKLLDKKLDEKPWVRAATNYYTNVATADAQTDCEGYVGILDLQDSPMNRSTQAQKEGQVLTEAYPSRVGGFNVVDPPAWIRVVFKFFKKIFPAKQIKRVDFCTRDELYAKMDSEFLPEELGGTLKYDPDLAAETIKAYWDEVAKTWGSRFEEKK